MGSETVFEYVAISEDGSRTHGRITAENAEEAKQRLQTRSLAPLTLDPALPTV